MSIIFKHLANLSLITAIRGRYFTKIYDCKWTVRHFAFLYVLSNKSFTVKSKNLKIYLERFDVQRRWFTLVIRRLYDRYRRHRRCHVFRITLFPLSRSPVTGSMAVKLRVNGALIKGRIFNLFVTGHGINSFIEQSLRDNANFCEFDKRKWVESLNCRPFPY